MKLEEMADVLDGLAGTLEKFLGKTAVSDFHALAGCLRKFPGETVAAFCNFTMQAREGKPAGRRAAGPERRARPGARPRRQARRRLRHLSHRARASRAQRALAGCDLVACHRAAHR